MSNQEKPPQLSLTKEPSLVTVAIEALEKSLVVQHVLFVFCRTFFSYVGFLASLLFFMIYVVKGGGCIL